MIVAGFDIETSGLEVGKARILEVAVVLYDTKERSIFHRWSSWVWDSAYPEPDPAALAVNGLKTEALKSRGLSPVYVFPKVKRLFELSDCIMGHNAASFDLPIMNFEFSQYSVELPKKTLIDTRTDLPCPPHMKSMRLSHLAVDHDVPFPTKHQALADVEAMCSIASNYDLDSIMERCKSPLIRIEAQISFKDNHEVKSRKYLWDSTKKLWWKNIRECDFEKECDTSNFVVFKLKDSDK